MEYYFSKKTKNIFFLHVLCMKVCESLKLVVQEALQTLWLQYLVEPF